MSEFQLQWVQGSKILVIAVYVMLYGLGGYKWKFLRRIVGSVFLTIAICCFAVIDGVFHWYLPVVALLLYGASSLPYGGETDYTILTNRFVFGLAMATAFLPLAFATGLWVAYGLHVGVCVIASVVIGVSSPFLSARAEETVLALLYSALPLFII